MPDPDEIPTPPSASEVVGMLCLWVLHTLFGLSAGLALAVYNGYVFLQYWRWFLENPYLKQPSIFTAAALIFLLKMYTVHHIGRNKTKEEKELEHSVVYKITHSVVFITFLWGFGWAFHALAGVFGS